MHIAGSFFTINNIIGAAFCAFYFYQFVFIPVAILRGGAAPDFPPAAARRYAIMICARNESAVIGPLLDSIRAQEYPQEFIDVYVIADNCTDDTAAVCRAKGASVVERFDAAKIGKGYALEYLLDYITSGGNSWEYEGYFIIDADNLLDPDFVAQMNNAVCAGNRIVTSYRNAKNYGDNWISASYGLWFLRESKYLNHAREVLGLSSQCSGTGFVIHRDVLKRLGGWRFFTLTEDVEFSFAMTALGERIAYQPRAVLYDEQPTGFGVAWKQRTRWVKGYFQTYALYGGKLLRGALRERRFPCYDMMASTFAGAVLTLGLLIFYLAAIVYHAALGLPLGEVLFFMAVFLMSCYGGSLVVGIVTTITEWDNIYCPHAKKRAYCVTFPLFLLTLMPIAIWAIFSRQRWPQVGHTRAIDIEGVKGGGR